MSDPTGRVYRLNPDGKLDMLRLVRPTHPLDYRMRRPSSHRRRLRVVAVTAARRSLRDELRPRRLRHRDERNEAFWRPPARSWDASCQGVIVDLGFLPGYACDIPRAE